MKWPDVIPKGMVCNRLASSVDILPTLVDIASASLPVNKIDGVSLLSILKGDVLSEPRKLFLYNELKAIRDNRFKLVMPQKYTSNMGTLPNDGGKDAKTFKGETDFALYDLRRDAGERYNVLEKYPAVVERLQKAMNQYKIELGENGYGLRVVGQIIK
jgi:arylsulfatase